MTVWLWLRTWEGRNKTPQQKRGNPACIFSNAREGPKKSKSSKMDWLQVFWNRNHCDLRTVSCLHACACCWTSFAWQAHSILMTQLTPGTSKSLRSKEHQGSAIPFDSEMSDHVTMSWVQSALKTTLQIFARCDCERSLPFWSGPEKCWLGTRGCQNIVEHSISHYTRNMFFLCYLPM